MRKFHTTLALAGALVLLAAAPAAAESGTYDSECTNSVTPDISEIAWGVDATATDSGGSVVVSGQQWQVTVPGSVFDAGVNLGLISDGQEVGVLTDVELVGSNTSERSIIAEDISLSLVVEVGADGASADATVPFAVPDMTFTSTGSPVEFSLGKMDMDVDIGLIAPIKFSCAAVAGQAPFLTVGAGGGGGDAQSDGGGQLAATGVDEITVWLLVGVGVVLVDVGYMTLSTLRPGRARSRD